MDAWPLHKLLLGDVSYTIKSTENSSWVCLRTWTPQSSVYSLPQVLLSPDMDFEQSESDQDTLGLQGTNQKMKQPSYQVVIWQHRDKVEEGEQHCDPWAGQGRAGWGMQVEPCGSVEIWLPASCRPIPLQWSFWDGVCVSCMGLSSICFSCLTLTSTHAGMLRLRVWMCTSSGWPAGYNCQDWRLKSKGCLFF